MLVAEGQFSFAAVPGVQVFPDDIAPQSFYALADAPRLAIAPDGEPEVGLTIFGRRVDDVFAASGGVLTLSALIGTTAEQQARLVALLAQRLADAGVEDPRPQLLSPEWIEATAEVHLVDGVDLTTSPSLSGENASSFNVKLSKQQADAVLAAWQDGLPDAVIRYHGRIRAAAGASGVEVRSTSTSVRSDDTRQTTQTLGLRAFAAPLGGALEVDATGRFTPPSSALGSRLQTVEL